MASQRHANRPARVTLECPIKSEASFLMVGKTITLIPIFGIIITRS